MTPRASQKAVVSQTVGVTDIKITYSRPGVKGRVIWGDKKPDTKADAGTAENPLVPFGQVWRTGANEATTFSVTDDVTINGQKLPKGDYSLHTIPGKDEWTIIFNSDPGQWGSFSYDEKKDTLRIRVKPEPAEMREWFTIGIPEVTPSTAKVVLRWEKIVVPFTVDVGDVNARTLEKARAAVAGAKPDDWRTPLQAANFALQNNASEEGWKWLEHSIKVRETYNNLALKARALAATGKTQEAIATAERAIEVGNKTDPKPDMSGLERQLGEWKAKM